MWHFHKIFNAKVEKEAMYVRKIYFFSLKVVKFRGMISCKNLPIGLIGQNHFLACPM